MRLGLHILIVLMTFTMSYGQIIVPQPKVTVTGVVQDNKAEPIIGASVRLEGSAIGTITDIDGMFSLKIPVKRNPVLIISYTVYQEKRVPLPPMAPPTSTTQNRTIAINVNLDDGAEPLYAVEEYEVAKIFFGTDRTYDSTKKLAKKFLNSQNRQSKIHWGSCEVSIPRAREPGEIPRPSWWNRLTRQTNNPEKFVMVLTIDVDGERKVLNALNDELQGTTDCSILLYIHGYNNSFEDAAHRTAQLSYDLGFKGRSIFYSWPSEKDFEKYPVDLQTAEWSRDNFKTFLFNLLDHTEYSNIYMVAHSMGNQLYKNALEDLIDERPQQVDRIREIILAAPDIDIEIFKRDIHPIFNELRAGITLYSSSKDLALRASKRFNGRRRLGDSGRYLTVLPNMETVDASKVKTDFIGHAVFANSTSIITDMYYLIEERRRASERKNLSIGIQDGLKYYKID